MFEEVLEKKLREINEAYDELRGVTNPLHIRKINRQKERESNAARYIVHGPMTGMYEQFKEVFGTDDPEVIYERLETGLHLLEAYALAVFPTTLSSAEVKEGLADSLSRLNWAAILELKENGRTRFVLKPTESGSIVLNGLRKAKGKDTWQSDLDRKKGLCEQVLKS